MTSLTSRDQIRRLVNELHVAWSLHQPERIDAIFTDDALYEDVAGGQVHRGKEETKLLLRTAFVWSPDFREMMKSLIIAENAAAAIESCNAVSSLTSDTPSHIPA